MPDPEQSRPDDPGATLGGGTVRMARPSEGEAPDHTQRLVLPATDDPPLRNPGVPVSAGTAGHTQSPSPRPRPSSTRGWKAPVLLVGLALAGGAAYGFFTRSKVPGAPPQVRPSAPEAVPPGAQIYLEQAKAGDAHAMRMLGVMYYYGLNVPQDREKGLYWYRKAAEKGSEAAKAELEKLESALR